MERSDEVRRPAQPVEEVVDSRRQEQSGLEATAGEGHGKSSENTAVGSTAGAIAGAAYGMGIGTAVGGPVGAVIGAAAGAATGIGVAMGIGKAASAGGRERDRHDQAEVTDQQTVGDSSGSRAG